jgi:tetratricopeptide (TPR) repeat protein
MKLSIVVFAGFTLLFATLSYGETLEQLQARAEHGEMAQVLDDIGARLTEHDNAQLRFLQARLLADAGRRDEAIAAYRELIQRYPQLPEPYNNLAALLAKKGQLKEAKELLEKAIRTHPSYAAIYDNLSVVFVELARDSYGKALRIKHSDDTLAMEQLAALTSPGTVQTPPAGQTTVEVATAGAPAAAKPPAIVSTATNDGDQTADNIADKTPPTAEPEEAAQAEPTPALPQNSDTEPAKHAAAPDEEQKQTPAALSIATDHDGGDADTGNVEKLGPPMDMQTDTADAPVPSPTVDTAPMVASAAEPAPTGLSDAAMDQQIITTLQGWAAAWSEQAVDLYLDFYAADYRPPDMTHQAWRQLRRTRLTRPQWIKVALSDFEVTRLGPDKARVKLIQRYRSNSYHDRTRKSFTLRLTADGWRISEETTLARLSS